MKEEKAFHVEYKLKGDRGRTSQIIRATTKKEAKEELFQKLTADPHFPPFTITDVIPLTNR